jgi:hypothetical protein
MRRYDWRYGETWDVPPPPGRGPARRGYDRGVYGGAYPGYGGRPGGDTRGLYYGGPGAYRRGGYAPRGGGERWQGYGGDFATEPFVPEEAYRRHPEYRRPAGRAWSRWDFEGDYEDLDDRQVARNVQRRLYEDVWLDVDRIRVEVDDGVVTLTGEVDDFLEARYAWDDAWESPGVRGVVNNLTVRTDVPRPDAQGDVVPQTARGRRTAAEVEAEGEAGG